MNKDTVTKLYKNVPSKDLAALAFHYALECNELEVTRIFDSVELKEYRAPDVAYIAWAGKLSSVAGVWGMMHWRLQTARAAALAMLAFNVQKGDVEVIESNAKDMDKVEAQLVALDNLLTILSETHGISPDDVRCYASTDAFMPSRENVEADLVYQSRTLNDFNSLLNV